MHLILLKEWTDVNPFSSGNNFNVGKENSFDFKSNENENPFGGESKKSFGFDDKTPDFRFTSDIPNESNNSPFSFSSFDSETKDSPQNDDDLKKNREKSPETKNSSYSIFSFDVPPSPKEDNSSFNFSFGSDPNSPNTSNPFEAKPNPSPKKNTRNKKN